MDPEFLTYPTTAGYKCTSARSETAESQDNVWRSHQVRTYLGPTEGGDERKLEIFLAIADALRKARELQMELGTPRAKLKFPIVWTPSRAFIFLPRVNQKKAGVGDACYHDYHFEFTPKRVLIMRRATATGTIGNRFAIFSHMPIRPDAVPIFDVSSLGKPIIRPAGNAIHIWADEDAYDASIVTTQVDPPVSPPGPSGAGGGDKGDHGGTTPRPGSERCLLA